MMNNQEYKRGYDHGSASTIDQKRGARDAFEDRKKKERKDAEYSQMVEKAHREHEENEQRLRQQERRKREYEQAQIQKEPRIKQPHPPHINKPIKSEWSNGAAIIGFLICAGWAATQAQELGGIIIAGLIGAVVMGRFYEVLIGFSILIMFLVGVANYI